MILFQDAIDMTDNIKIFGYDVTIYIQENGFQNVRVAAKMNKSRATKGIMIKIYKYLISEGFIKNRGLKL